MVQVCSSGLHKAPVLPRSQAQVVGVSLLIVQTPFLPPLVSFCLFIFLLLCIGDDCGAGSGRSGE